MVLITDSFEIYLFFFLFSNKNGTVFTVQLLENGEMILVTGKTFTVKSPRETKGGTRISCQLWLKEIEQNVIVPCCFTPFSTQIASTV